MQIAILLYEGFTALDAIGPYEVLSRIPGAHVHFVAKKTGPHRADTRALALVADRSLQDMPRADILVVPGGAVGTYAAANDATIQAWVRTVHASSRWTTSVCTGSLILGAAGLLRGLPATTHWAARRALPRYGAIYKPERFIQSGNIITAAGVSAGIDMALFLVSQVADADLARAIQLGIEYDPQPPFDAGSLHKASKQTIRRANQILWKATLVELGYTILRRFQRGFSRKRSV